MNMASKAHEWINSLIKDRFPLLSLYYSKKPRAFFHWRKQPVAHLLKGRLKKKTTKQSVIFFTVHKSASTFIKRFLQDLSLETGHHHIDINGYYVLQGEHGKNAQKDPEILRKLFSNTGYIYGPLREYLPVQNLDEYRIVLILRDPRDVLTSQYFSIKYSHPINSRIMMERRNFTRRVNIDQHVLSERETFLKRYTEYIEKIINRDNVLFIQYEEMIEKFPDVLDKINNHCSLAIDNSAMVRLDRSSEFSVERENPHNHKRKVKSGDYRDKLQRETIKILNHDFRGILNKLGYSPD